MNHTLKLNITETINAPVAAVWNALTDAAMINKYFFGTEAASTWEKGSPVTFKEMWDGQSYTDKGAILEVEKEKSLQLLEFSVRDRRYT